MGICWCVVQLLSHIWLFGTARTAACQASLSSAISQSLLKFMSIEVVMLSIHLILCHSLLLLPSVFPIIRVFSSESSLHIRWPKYWSFSNRPSNEYSGLISFRIDWFDLLADQGTQESSPAHLAPSLGAQLKLSSAHFSCILVNRCSLGPLLFASSWMRWLLCGSSGYQLCLCDHWKSTGVLKIWWIRPAPPTGLHVPVI